MSLQSSWRAHLELGFRRAGPRTVLAHRRHHGPLVVQRPFYPEGGTCHVYLVHPPGGIVGGDQLDLHVDVEADAHALLTTPAATKFYRAGPHPQAVLHQVLKVKDGTLEWLPQENIVFEGARARTVTSVHLAGNAQFLGWEVCCLGRPANSERFSAGELAQDFRLYVNDSPILLERLRIQGGSEALAAAWGLGGSQAMGTLLMYPAQGVDPGLLRALDGGAARHAISVVDNLLICRAHAEQAEAVRNLFSEIWLLLRQFQLGRAAVAPRIWAT